MAVRLGWAAAAAALILSSHAARAEPPEDDPPDARTGDPADAFPVAPGPTPSDQRNLRVTFESLAALAVPGMVYWATADANSLDWNLDWDAESWKKKLFTFDAVRFDTNEFSTNGVRHPIAGVVHYQIGRANGFGMLGSSAINLLSSLVWEYLIEYREYVSLNDIIMNFGTGISIGEPLLQLGRFGSHATNGIARGAAAVASPFDALHGWAEAGDDRLAPWHRIELAAGLSQAVFDGESRRSEAVFAADLELVTQPGYGRPGSQSGGTSPGAWSRLGCELRLAPSGDGSDDRAAGIYFATQTSIAGHYAQDIEEAPRGQRGTGRFVGIGSAFTYHRRRISEDWDRLSIAHLVGPRLELADYAPAYTLRWELAAYADFALVQAHVFAPKPRLAPVVPLASALVAEGYYFAHGVTLVSRVRFEAEPWTVAVALVGHQFWSIDGFDRHELDDKELDPEDVVDQRVFGRLDLAWRRPGTALSIGTVLDLALRRGAWEDLERSASEVGARAYIGWSF